MDNYEYRFEEVAYNWCPNCLPLFKLNHNKCCGVQHGLPLTTTTTTITTNTTTFSRTLSFLPVNFFLGGGSIIIWQLRNSAVNPWTAFPNSTLFYGEEKTGETTRFSKKRLSFLSNLRVRPEPAYSRSFKLVLDQLKRTLVTHDDLCRSQKARSES